MEGGAADEGGFGAPCVSASRASPPAPLGVGSGSAVKSTKWDPPGCGASAKLVHVPKEMPQYNSTSKVAGSYFIGSWHLWASGYHRPPFVDCPTRLKHSKSGRIRQTQSSVLWSAHITGNLAAPEVNDDVKRHKHVKLVIGIGWKNIPWLHPVID